MVEKTMHGQYRLCCNNKMLKLVIVLFSLCKYVDKFLWQRREDYKGKACASMIRVMLIFRICSGFIWFVM